MERRTMSNSSGFFVPGRCTFSLTVNLQQDVAGLQAHLGGGHSLVGFGDDGAFQVRIPRDDGADAAVAVLQHLLQFVLVVLRIIHGIGVQRIEHRVDALADGFVGVDGVHVEQIQFLHDGIEDVQVLGHLETPVVTACKSPKGNEACP